MGQGARDREHDENYWFSGTHSGRILPWLGETVAKIVPVLKWLYSFLMPGGLLVLASVALLRPRALPEWTLPLVGAYCYIIFGLGVLLGWYLERSRIIFAVVVFILADWAMLQVGVGEVGTGGPGRILFNAVAFLLPLNLLALSLITERGLDLRRELIQLGLVLVQAAFVAWLYLTNQSEISAALENPLFDPRYSAWTPIPQPGLLAFGVALGFLLFRAVLFRNPLEKRNAIEIGFVWALVAVFIALHGGLLGWAPTNYFATAALILMIAVFEASHKSTYYDELTGLRGRFYLNGALNSLGGRYAIAMVDIDHFKDVNMSHGYQAGNEVLRMVAAKIAQVSGGGEAFRYEEEQFAVIFKGKSVDETRPHLETLRKAVESSSFALRGPGRPVVKPETTPEVTSPKKELKVTVSIGVAERDAKKTTTDLVVKAAQKALFRAKHAGRNLVKS